MRKRRKLLLAFLATIVLGGLLLCPPVYWRLAGTQRGEAFWKGRPTSYYRERIRALGGTYYVSPPYGLVECIVPAPRWEPWVRRNLGRSATRLFWTPESPLRGADRGAVPVLTELVRDPDRNVQIAALTELDQLGSEASAALPAVRTRLAICDSNDSLRSLLERVIFRIDPSPSASDR